MDGRVRVWRHARPKRGPTVDAPPESPDAWKYWEFLTSLEAGGEVQWLQWHPKGAVLAAGCEDSSVWLWTCECCVGVLADGKYQLVVL